MFRAMGDLSKWRRIAAIGQNKDIHALKNMVNPGIQQGTYRNDQAKFFFYLPNNTRFQGFTQFQLAAW